MSEPRLIYPLLEGFLLGDAISEHNGVRCYPALRQKSGEKYIVKVISIPASRVQLDALLLTGAFSGKKAALAYFRELAQDMVQEADILRQLSQQEGFVPYENSQIVASADGNGYEVYFLGTFKRSMDRILAANTMNQRGLIDLGLDLCAALAACRRAGYLYVDLKPGNIFYTDDHGYRIGDVGFVPLSSLKFTPLQNQYRSRYTAPELSDDFAVINPTVDIYAMGLILYQACNGGELPGKGKLIPPMYADYELAEIILKACAADPADRWQDPTQIAQALIGYLQRNEVTDAPLIPAPVETSQEESPDAVEFLPEATPEELSMEMAQLHADELIILQAISTGEVPAGVIIDTDLSDDISEMLAHADELIAHELPEPAMAPDPIEVPMPEPILPKPEPAPESESAPEQEVTDEPPAEQAPEPPKDSISEKVPVHTEMECPRERRPFPWRGVLGVLIVILLLLAGFQARRYYQDVYLQNIDEIIITHTNDTATVKIVSSIDESLLNVVCTDSYGNAQRSQVTAGVAVFTGLNPQTRYTVRIEISGTHKLTGITTDSFTTPAQTQILSFIAGIGPEDASVLLTLTVSGPAVESWTLSYFADETDIRSTTFIGSHVTVYDLEIGKDYTFTLSADGQMLGGITQTTFTATNIILAQDLAITACGNGSLTAQWAAPDGITVKNGWAVRCYNSSGYDQTVVTYEPWFTFEGLDHRTECTIEVTAVGMNRNVSTTIDANPVTIEDYEFSVSVETGLTIRWNYSGSIPENGWTVHYTVDGVPYSLTTETAEASVYALPGGVYSFTIEAAGTTVFGGTAAYELTEVGSFTGYGISAQSLAAELALPQIILTADSETVIEASEDTIEILCILRSADGMLLDAAISEAVWNTLWIDNTCTLTLPAVPTDPGTYHLSVYFAGGLVTEQDIVIA